MKDEKLALRLMALGMIMLVTVAGCSNAAAAEASAYGRAAVIAIPVAAAFSQETDPFSIPMPVATGTNAVKNQTAELDLSGARDGYVMARYLAKTGKAIKAVITAPDGTPYIYRLRADGEYEVLPISAGNGYYQITIYENAFENKYLAVLKTALHVRLTDEFAPFLRPNQYVNYNEDSKTTQKAAELTKNTSDTAEQIAAIYRYVVQNISYDYQLSNTIQAGYIPDVDKVLQSGKGICFDYAAVMAAMLRSQGIPTKLVVGYRGADYHAWISAYSNEAGWMDGVVYFDGKSWRIMDPTLDAYARQNGEARQLVGQGTQYLAKYFY